MQSRSNITATTERDTRIVRCRAAFRRRETISREWGDYETPGPTTCELRKFSSSSAWIAEGDGRLGTRPRASELESSVDLSIGFSLRYPTRVPAECIGEVLVSLFAVLGRYWVSRSYAIINSSASGYVSGTLFFLVGTKILGGRAWRYVSLS